MSKTVGQASLEAREDTHTYEVGEVTEAAFGKQQNNKSFEQNLLETIESGRRAYDGVYFVVVLNKRERLLPNVIRRLYFHRESCPTPEFDQTVYEIDPSQDRISYLWTLPDWQTCQLSAVDPDSIPKVFYPLAGFISDFQSGKLDKLARSKDKAA